MSNILCRIMSVLIMLVKKDQLMTKNCGCILYYEFFQSSKYDTAVSSKNLNRQSTFHFKSELRTVFAQTMI